MVHRVISQCNTLAFVNAGFPVFVFRGVQGVRSGQHPLKAPDRMYLIRRRVGLRCS